VDLVLIRHPAVAVEAGVCYGASDVALAGDAAREAAVLASRLDALGARAPLRIESSPLARCANVANALAVTHGLTPGIDARLAEMDFGAWELQRWDAIGREQIDAWAADFDHARPHGGESVAQFEARVRAWFDGACIPTPGVATPGTRTSHDVAWVVTHAGVIRAMTACALGLPLARCVRWPLEYGALVWLRREARGGSWLLVRWNA
jgi:alpha-ribazole phosphatase